MKGRIFISYSPEDGEIVQTIQKRLERFGRIRWDSTALLFRIGAMAAEAEKYIRRANYFLVVVSKAALRSEFVRRDVRIALDESRNPNNDYKVVAVVLPGMERSQAEILFSPFPGEPVYISVANTSSDLDEAIFQIAVAIGLQQPEEAAPSPSGGEGAEPEEKEGPPVKDEAEPEEETTGNSRGFFPVEEGGGKPSVIYPEAPVQREETTSSKGLDLSDEETTSSRIVNTGFADASEADAPLSPDQTLAASHDYFFWLEVGELMARSIETHPSELPVEKLPEEAGLDVALYSRDEGFELDDKADVGKLKIRKDGKVEVARQPMQPFKLELPDGLAKKRLFFPLKTKGLTGEFGLSCNIYCQGILVQSREISAVIQPAARPMEKALRSELEYSLTATLTAEQLNRYREHKLSVLLSESDDDTHGFQFFGSGQFKNTASFGEGEVEDSLKQIRGALRKAAWGTEELYDGQPYRYQDGAKDLDRLATDLYRLAKRGARFYQHIRNRLAGGRRNASGLEKMMLSPGYVQFVLQKGARNVLPLAALYDHKLDTGVPSSEAYSLCDTFVKTLKENKPLAKSPCFTKGCEHRDDKYVVCPSGFWGFRHYLGFPHSISHTPFAPAEIFYRDKLEVAMAAWAGDDFKMREEHKKHLQSTLKKAGWYYAEDRDQAIQELKEHQPHLVYLYCHGGVSDTVPYLLVGDNESRVLTSDFIGMEDILWDESTPLVFINGCHTTALEPEQALEFVSAFVENALAAGVIGTEITIFEPLATSFAETFLSYFIKGVPAGKAIRDARLDILQQYNPLGLVYIPYVISGLQLVKKGAGE